ncbi:Sporulation domain protein [Thioalkalivibrio sp. K90mix]|uniref:SPOR domain-containing protein n=1 Tax=Thioalkalivibrio sp. (strain K90mix) TaxID=396595 RepID=UPI000195A9C9|nr:SPOR domain-containing protein [Thioalkalivibrio sp. K90mix]ADC71838.1 Sporulation domain protein [Thioalkalivibrio sp. K90mix]
MTTDNPIRFRLTGAVILIVIAVIFLPWLFDGAGYEYMSGIDDPVPDTPTFAAPDIALPSEREAAPARPEREGDGDSRIADLQGVENGGAEGDEDESEPSDVVSPEPVRQAPESRAIDAGWAVQVGSYRDGDNAREEEARLRDAGLPAFIDESEAEGRSIYRVKVGPVAQRDEAQKLGDQLKDELDITGIVVTFP